MIGVFCFEATWTAWSDAEMAAELERLRDLGATAVVTETIEPPTRLIRAADAQGLETHVSVPCFSAHAWPHLSEGLDVQPISADGSPRATMEWYTGLIPTHDGYKAALAQRIDAIAGAAPAGLILDFIRWPLHWETELRASTPPPDEASFDARTIAVFAAWLEARGIAVDGDPDAQLMLGPLREAWTDFKCEVITTFACDAARSVRAIAPGTTVGAFIVPAGHEERRRLVGQDVEALSACLDVFHPMTYHAILEETPELVGRIVGDIRARTSTPVIPVVQVTADPAIAHPWDWGPEFPASELGSIVEDALAMSPGVVLFAIEGLDAERRAAVAEAIGSRRR